MKIFCFKDRGMISVNVPELLSIRLGFVYCFALFLLPKVYFNGGNARVTIFSVMKIYIEKTLRP